jgi:ATP-dependent RNA helicase DDX31/DBP7
MADDGLLVNFTISDAPILPKTVLRGGPWQERRRIRHVQKLQTDKSNPKRGQDQVSNDHADEDAAEYQEDREPKKRRIAAAPDFRARYRPQQQQQQPGSESRESAGLPKQVVSSLFSSNPVSKTNLKAVQPEKSTEAIEPSNAPLTEEQLNFVSLGLSPVLATHLTTKMSISAPMAIQKAAIGPLLTSDDDAFIQAETGSGKTLAYLLPIVQRIMDLAKTDGIKRKSGLFAIILAPTRELTKQISAVLERLLRCAHWIVAGTVTGGEQKKREKARIRKGFNILVATPGRLADHLTNTEALDASSVRWLVLDEGDRLMELGFDEDIKKILSCLDFRLRKGSSTALDSLPKKRVTILCSATMRTDVQELGDITLRDAIHISADKTEADEEAAESQGEEKEKVFSVPAQLKQSYSIIPAKLRLVALVATLKRGFIRCEAGTKVIVFASCADSVDFHFLALTRDPSAAPPEIEPVKPEWKKHGRKDQKREKPPPKPVVEIKTSATSPSLASTPDQTVTVFRLHGSLQQSLRTSTLKAFSDCATPAVLLCTDIASRGLDLPHVDRVIEFDPAFSREEHMHRVGRTARAGKDGFANIFLMPGCEEGYVEVLQAERGQDTGSVKGLSAEQVLKAGFPSQTTTTTTTTTTNPQSSTHNTRFQPDRELLPAWEQLATDFQLGIERWALGDATVLEAARRGFQSHIRAYATHVKDERQWFDMKQLHLGHLAKAFALRDRPGSVNVPGMRANASKVKADRRKAGIAAAKTGGNAGGGQKDAAGGDEDWLLAMKKMQKMSKKMAGAGEFNIG